MSIRNDATLTRRLTQLKVRLLLAIGFQLSTLCAARVAAQVPADTAAAPPIVLGVGAVVAGAHGAGTMWGAGPDAEVVIPLPVGVVGYRLHGFGTFIPDYGQVCALSCTPQGGTLYGASAGLAFLTDVHERVARTQLSVGPAVLAGSESGSKEVTYLWGIDGAMTRLLNVGGSSGFALSLEPVLIKPNGFVWFVMAGARAEFW